MPNDFKLAIDAGHGMSNRKSGIYDPGVIRTFSNGKTVKEADIALQWALTGKFILQELHDVPVFLSRDDPFDEVPVSGRDDAAWNAGCTHFISLHVDSWDGPGRGLSCFYRDDESFATTVLDCYITALISEASDYKSRGVKNEKDTHVKRLAINDFKGKSCLLELGRIEDDTDLSLMTSKKIRIAFWEEFYERLKNGFI